MNAGPGEVGEEGTNLRRTVGDSHGDARVVDLDPGAGRPLQSYGGRRGVRRGGEAEADEVTQPGLEPGSGVVGDDLAVVDHDHPAGQGVGLLEVVGGEHDRAAGVLVQAADEVLEVGAVLGVETGRRLVEEQHAGQVDQAHRDVEPAPLAPGERGDLAVGHGGEVEVLDEVGGPASGLAPRQAVGAALADQLVAAELAVTGAVALADVADRAAYLALSGDDVMTGDLGGPRRRRDESGEHAQGGRLARTVGAEEGDELALTDLQVEATDGFDGLLARREVAGQATGHDRWLSAGV